MGTIRGETRSFEVRWWSERDSQGKGVRGWGSRECSVNHTNTLGDVSMKSSNEGKGRKNPDRSEPEPKNRFLRPET